ELRAHIRNIQNGEWSGYREPYMSKALKEILRLPEEQPSPEQIIEEKFKELGKIIKNLPTLKDLKDLKESIENLKTNK
ncbi:12830_t:CDS:1, partial [Dentiscutata heterogama]